MLGLMDAGDNHGSAVKGLAIDLEVPGSCPIGCFFSIPSSFFIRSEECEHATLFLFLNGLCTRKRIFWRGQEQYSP